MADTIVEFNTLEVGPDEVATHAVLFTTEAGQVSPASSYTASLQSGSAQYQITVPEACVGIYRLEAYNGDGLTLAQGWVWIEADDTATYIADGSYNAVKLRVDSQPNVDDWADGGRLDLLLDAILTDTGTTLPATLSSMQTTLGTVDTATGGATTTLAAILEDTGTDIPATLSSMTTTLASILQDTGTTLEASIAGLNDITAADVLAAGDVDGYTLEEALKLMAAVTLGKVTGGGTTSNVFRAADDSKDRVTATVDTTGNRSSITLDATG